jgi:hypothetical protein
MYVDQDTDPDVFESLIRIRSKIVRIRNTACSTTRIWQVNLLKNELLQFVPILQTIYAKFELLSHRSWSRIMLWLRFHKKDAAPAPQHKLTRQLLGFFQYECTYFKCKYTRKKSTLTELKSAFIFVSPLIANPLTAC